MPFPFFCDNLVSCLMSDVFHCKHGTFCVTATARCDDIDDCGDYSDETGCGRLISAILFTQ